MVLEALYLDLPVITSDWKVIPRNIGHDKCGIVISHLNAGALKKHNKPGL